MHVIRSPTDSALVLHSVFGPTDFKDGRVDLSPVHEILQVSAMTFHQGKIIAPHKHKIHERKTSITQESIIILEGSIEATYYDENGKLLETLTLLPGMLSVTFGGGHSFKVLNNNTKIYEIKNGPYIGKEFDYEPL